MKRYIALLLLISLVIVSFAQTTVKTKFIEQSRIDKNNQTLEYSLKIIIPANSIEDGEYNCKLHIKPALSGMEVLKQTLNSKTFEDKNVDISFSVNSIKGKETTVNFVRVYKYKNVSNDKLKSLLIINTNVIIVQSGEKIGENKNVVKPQFSDETVQEKISENTTEVNNTEIIKPEIENVEQKKESQTLPANISEIQNEIDKSKKEGNNKRISELYKKLGEKYNLENNYEQARTAYEQAIEYSEKNKDKFTAATLYTDIGEMSYKNDNGIQAIEDFNNALDYFEEEGKTKFAEVSYNNLAVIYNSMAFYQNAVDSYKKALEKVPNNDKTSIAKYNGNIAEAYRKMKKLEKAAEHYELVIAAESSDNIHPEELILSLNNASSVYAEMGNYDKAKSYISKAIEIEEKKSDKKNVQLYNNLGNIEFLSGDKDKAITDYEKVLANVKDTMGRSAAVALHNIGKSYFLKKDYQKADTYFQRSINISKASKFNDLVSQGNFMLSEIIAAKASCKADFELYKNLLSDGQVQIFDSQSPLGDVSEKYETEVSKEELMVQLKQKDALLKKQAEISEKQNLKNKLLQVNNQIQIAENNRQKTLILYLVCGIVLFLLLAGFAFRQYLLKRKANQNLIKQNAHILMQSEEINAQSEELIARNEKITAMNTDLEEQKKEIENKNNKITASIHYAQNIQKAILPGDNLLSKLIDEYFVIFKPRDIISGDFYWASQINQDEFIVVAADCTGHGVPGAMMSMLGVALLNEIIIDKKIYEPGIILDRLRELVISSLGHTERTDPHAPRDGMDMALLRINKKAGKLVYAGARNPLVLVRNRESTVYDADNMPVGDFLMSENAKQFKSTEVEIEKGDLLYIFSDGFADQIGGPKKRKYFKKNLEQLLVKVCNENMQIQKETIENEYDTWKGNLKQIDDVLVFGIKITA